MSARYFSLVLGIIFILVALMGFTGIRVTHPAVDAHAQHLSVHAEHGYVMGLFPVNVVHNLVHLLSGVVGVIAFRRLDWSRVFCRVLAVMYGLVTLMGICPDPRINTFFGLMPIHGNDVWLHAVITIAAAYFGWAYRPSRAAEPFHDGRVHHA